jgi:DNA-binding MarR family transcriptional regulator
MTDPTPLEQTRWLDPEEQRAWRAYLRGAALAMDALDRDLQAHGVSLSEYEILTLVSESPDGRQRMSVLADAVVQSRSRLTHTAARLERRGWVQRRQSPHDRRGVELCLTAAGHEVLAALAPVHVEGVRRILLDPLGREAFLQLGETMATVAEAAVES